MGIKLMAVFTVSAAFGVLCHTPRGLIIPASMIGVAAWLLAMVTKNIGGSLIMGNFVGSIMIGLGAEFFARLLKKPTAIFIIPGFIPLVPGGDAYTTVLYMVEGRYIEGVSMFMRTVLTAGAIAFGIFISSTIYRLLINYIMEKKRHHAGEN